MSGPTLWFSTRSNGTLHHALAEGTCGIRVAKCNSAIVPRLKEEARPQGELPEYAKFCPRCWTKIGAPVVEPKPEDTAPVRVATEVKRLTASQTWERLTLVQREALLGWFVGSYAPSRNAARFPLVKTTILTHAEMVIAENWRGLEP